MKRFIPLKTLLLLLISFNCHAITPTFLKDVFDDVLVNSTSAGEMSSSARGGAYFGGSFSIRQPIHQVTLGHIEAPSFSYGCNGLDMTFGSFSFISADELKNLLKAVVSAAPSYAFGLAIDAMCGNCFSMMKELANDVNEMMKSMKNSCELTKDLVDFAFNEANISTNKSKNEKDLNGVERSINMVRSGLDEGFQWFQKNTNSAFFPKDSDFFGTTHSPSVKSNDEYFCENEDAAKELSFNSTWDSLKENDELFDWFGGLISDSENRTKSREFLMTFLGFEIFNFPTIEPTEEGGSHCGPPDIEEKKDIVFDDFDIFVTTSSKAHPIYKCDDAGEGEENKCLVPTKSKDYKITLTNATESIVEILNDLERWNKDWTSQSSEDVTAPDPATLKWLDYHPDLIADVRNAGKDWENTIAFYREHADVLAYNIVNDVMGQVLEVMEQSMDEQGSPMSNPKALSRVRKKIAKLEKWYQEKYIEYKKFSDAINHIRQWRRLNRNEFKVRGAH